MDSKEITEGNKLIALFMGAKIIDPIGHTRRDIRLSAETHGLWVHCSSELKYHSSWDWLMPVVYKLPYKSDYHFLDEKSEAIVKNLKEALFFVEIDKAWQAVVQFITWYNQNSAK